jgi:putative transposase
MARHPRLVVPGVALHVVQRGVDRRDCFAHDSDYFVYLSNLRELAAHKKCALHAYCLMTNHVHLLITPKDAQSCATMMRDLGQRYVSYFNRRYGRTGTLWEGRFRSCLVDSAQYAIACHRYIERNPVRAGMVTTASAYPWSSYSSNAGERIDPSLTPHNEYLALGLVTASRIAAYRGLFDDADEPGFLGAIRDATNSGYATLIGDELKQRLATISARPLARGKPGPKREMEEASGCVSGELDF